MGFAEGIPGKAVDHAPDFFNIFPCHSFYQGPGSEPGVKTGKLRLPVFFGYDF